MRISPSQLKVWFNCRQEWYYSYREGLQVNRPKKVFEKGLFIHQLLHVNYQTIQLGYVAGSPMIEMAMDSRMRSDLEDADHESVILMSQCFPLIKKFVAAQSPRIDKGITVLGVELEYYIMLEGGLILHGFIDLVYRDAAGKLRVRDHKTSAQKNSWNSEMLNMEDQLLQYCIAASVIFGEHEDDYCLSAEVNFINTYDYKQPRPASELFDLFRVVHSKIQLFNYLDNLNLINKEMERGVIYRRYSKDCATCRFYKICKLETKGMDVTGLKKTYFLDKSH